MKSRDQYLNYGRNLSRTLIMVHGLKLKGGGARFKGGDTVCSSSIKEYGLGTCHEFMN